MHGDGISTVVEIQPEKTPLMSIQGVTLDKENTDYAVRLTYNIDSTKYPLDANSKLIFTFIADHSLSNTTRCVKREYTAQNIIEGVFQIGKSMKIIRSING